MCDTSVLNLDKKIGYSVFIGFPIGSSTFNSLATYSIYVFNVDEMKQQIKDKDSKFSIF